MHGTGEEPLGTGNILSAHGELSESHSIFIFILCVSILPGCAKNNQVVKDVVYNRGNRKVLKRQLTFLPAFSFSFCDGAPIKSGTKEMLPPLLLQLTLK